MSPSPSRPFDAHGKLFSPITVAEALLHVRRHAADTERHSMATVDQWIAALYRVLEYRYPALTRDEIKSLEFGPELPLLVEDATAAFGDDVRGGRDAGTRLRRFFEYVVGGPYGSSRLKQRFAPSAWHPFVEAARSAGTPQPKMVHVYNTALACHAMRHADAPRSLPDRPTLLAGLRRHGLPPKTNHLAPAFRSARDAALSVDPSLVIAEMPPAPYANRVDYTLTDEEMAERMPEMWNDLQFFLKVSCGQGDGGLEDARSPDTDRSVRRSYRLLAGIYEFYRARHPELLVAPEPSKIACQDFINVYVTITSAAKRGRYEVGTQEERVPLIRRLLDLDAPAARLRSTRFKDARTGYTPSQLTILNSLGTITRRAFAAVRSEDLVTVGPRYQLDDEMKVRFHFIHKHVLGNLIPEAERRGKSLDKTNIIRLLTAPLLQVVGLPWYLRYVVEPAETVYRAARARATACGHDPDAHPAVLALRATYRQLRLRYLLCATAFDDSLRIKNYANGLSGPGADSNFQLSKIDGRFEVRTNWRWEPRSTHGVKNLRKKRLARPLRPGAVDLTQLWKMIEPGEEREANLRLLGLLKPDELYDPINDGRFPLFVTPRMPDDEKGWANRTPGAYGRECVSEHIGRVLHAVIRDCLGHDVPAWDDLGDEWAGLLRGHILRTLMATYWVEVRGNNKEAMDRTLDDEEALEWYLNECKIMAEEMKLEKNKGTWLHPSTYDAWMDRILGGDDICPLDDPKLPLPPHLAAVMKKGVPVLPVPDIRRARPEQAERMKGDAARELRGRRAA